MAGSWHRRAALAMLLLPSSLPAQAPATTLPPPRPVNATTLNDALPTVLKSLFTMTAADELLASESIQSLEKDFAEARNDSEKAEAARVLVRLKDPKSEYYDFLEKLAIKISRQRRPRPGAVRPRRASSCRNLHLSSWLGS